MTEQAKATPCNRGPCEVRCRISTFVTWSAQRTLHSLLRHHWSKDIVEGYSPSLRIIESDEHNADIINSDFGLKCQSRLPDVIHVSERGSGYTQSPVEQGYGHLPLISDLYLLDAVGFRFLPQFSHLYTRAVLVSGDFSHTLTGCFPIEFVVPL